MLAVLIPRLEDIADGIIERDDIIFRKVGWFFAPFAGQHAVEVILDYHVLMFQRGAYPFFSRASGVTSSAAAGALTSRATAMNWS